MKKFKINLILAAMLIVLSSHSIKANNARLVTLTPNSWVENHHLPWIGVKYTGICSVNGLETYRENGTKLYARTTKITYVLPNGTRQSTAAHSSGSTTQQRKIEVFDSANPWAEKTKAFYDYKGVPESQKHNDVWSQPKHDK